MAVFALTNAYVYVAGHDFTGDSNQLALAMDVAALDRTTFRSNGSTELTGGLRTSTFNLSGFWQSATTDAVDVESFPDLGVVNRAHTVGQVETEGGPAYMWQGGKFSYALGGTLGELTPFTLSSQGTDGAGVIRGQLAKKVGTVSAAGQLGSGLNLGNALATQRIYATLHVLSAGTSLTATVERAANNTFASATTVGTIGGGPITTRGATWFSSPTIASSNPWYRINVTVATGTWVLAAAIGLQ